MRLLMVGAGGIGGYFGACFAAAGHDVTFLARGATLAALRERGLTVESTVAPAHLAVKATDRAEDAGRPDAIVLCTKLADLDSAAAQVAPIADGALVVTQLAFVDGLHPQARPSLLLDLTEGRRLEAPWLSGAVVRMADEAGIEVPVVRTLYAALKPYLDGAPAH
jgi:ketopantoate reductase